MKFPSLFCLSWKPVAIQRHYQLIYPLCWTGDKVMCTELSEVSALKVDHI